MSNGLFTNITPHTVSKNAIIARYESMIAGSPTRMPYPAPSQSGSHFDTLPCTTLGAGQPRSPAGINKLLLTLIKGEPMICRRSISTRMLPNHQLSSALHSRAMRDVLCGRERGYKGWGAFWPRYDAN